MESDKLKAGSGLASSVMIVLLLCLTFAWCSMIGDDDDEVVERVQVGDRVPSFSVALTLPSADEGRGEPATFSTAALTGETVIVFFNTWCSDCQRELPRLNEYYLQHRGEAGFQMVAISRAEEEDKVAAFWAANQLQIPYSAQADRRVYELFATSVIPRIYYVSRKGIVTKVFVEQWNPEG